MEKAGSADFAGRWGSYSELEQAAERKPIIDNIYGFKRDITEHKAIHVLRSLAYDHDRSRLMEHVNHYYQKQGAKG
jgi:hypothetical protein